MDEYLLMEDQRAVEFRYSKKQIKKRIQKEINQSEEILLKLENVVKRIDEWRVQPFYESKERRLAMLADIDLHELVMDMETMIISLDQYMLLTAVTGELANYLNYSDHVDSIKTIAEIISFFAEEDLVDLFRGGNDSIRLESCYMVSDECREYINETKYLPPMLVPPVLVRANNESGYLETRKSLILGSGNYHEENICLDSINKFNQVPFSLDLNLLRMYEEMPKKVLDTQEKKEAFSKMKSESLKTYVHLAAMGNRFWFTHGVDKRGRTYVQGYHVNTQGSSFKKAIVNLADEEHVEVHD